MIRIRVDDFPQTKGEPQHTLEAFRQFHRELTACTGVRYLLGVIPGRSSPEDLLFLARETDCVIGMHGTDHDERRLDHNGGNQFEPYLTRQEVARVLREARSSLEGVVGRPVKVYMPPRNVISTRDLGALWTEGVGFEWFTSGPESEPWAQEHSRAVFSAKPHEYGRTDEMMRMESHRHLIAKCDRGEDVVLALHWTWETNIGLQHMREFLSKIPRKYFADFDA